MTDEDPLALFLRWLAEAERAGVTEPGAMALATADTQGRPAVRTVLLRGADGRGLRFFTNYDSPKARDLEANARAAVALTWAELHRQVRASGPVTRLPGEESDAYFAGRPRGAQLGAWASPQSSVLSGREELDTLLAAAEREYDGRAVPRPPHWGGFLLSPLEWEFWSGRRDRLHDRVRYRQGRDGWISERLAP